MIASLSGSLSEPLEVSAGGRWRITFIPPGWEYIPGFGIRHASPGHPPGIVLTEDVLLAGEKLDPYVQAQITIMKRNFAEVSVAGPEASTFPGADESMLMLLKHPQPDGEQVLQLQQYVRQSKWIGIVTLTALESWLARSKNDFQAFVRGLQIVNFDSR